MDGLLVRRQVEIMAEGLPAHGAGVQPLRRGSRRRRLVALGTREEVRASGVCDLADGGGGGTFDSSSLVVNLPFPVQLPVSHQALRVRKHLPTQVALVVLLARVDGQVLGEVERLPEHFAADVAGVRLLPGVDAVVAPQGLRPSEALAAEVTRVRPLRAVPRRRGAPPSPHDGVGVPFVSGFPRPPGLGVGLAGMRQRQGGAVQGGRRPPEVTKPQPPQQPSDDVPPLPVPALRADVAGGRRRRRDGRHGAAGDLVLGVVQQGGQGEVGLGGLRRLVMVRRRRLLTLRVRVEGGGEGGFAEGLAGHLAGERAHRRVQRRGLRAAVVVDAVVRRRGLVAIPGVIGGVLLRHHPPPLAPTFHLTAARGGRAAAAGARAGLGAAGGFAAGARSGVVEEGGALPETAPARGAAEGLLVVDLLVAGERLAAVEGLLADGTDEGPVLRVSDAVLDEVTPLLKPLPTLAAAEDPLRAGRVAVQLPALALRGQAVAAQVAAQAGEVGEGLTALPAVVEGLGFGPARRAAAALLGFGRLLVPVGHEHRGGVGGGGGRRGGGGGDGGGRLLRGR